MIKKLKKSYYTKIFYYYILRRHERPCILSYSLTFFVALKRYNDHVELIISNHKLKLLNLTDKILTFTLNLGQINHLPLVKEEFEAIRLNTLNSFFRCGSQLCSSCLVQPDPTTVIARTLILLFDIIYSRSSAYNSVLTSYSYLSFDPCSKRYA